MTTLGRFKAFMRGSCPEDPQKVFDDLKAADVPVAEADCRACPHPCDRDHDDFTTRINVDMDSDMLGSVKPYRRQVIISTGQSDWHKEVTEAEDTFAALLCSTDDKLRNSVKLASGGNISQGHGRLPAGLFTQDDTRRLAILNGSHRSFSRDPAQETVIVLPDFKVVADVPCSIAGAETLWSAALDPSYGRSGGKSRSDSLKSWVLPYSCLVLLCSHKRRDKRCAIAAPILEKTLIQCLESEGWEAHTELEDLSSYPSLESSICGEPDAEAAFEAQLRTLPDQHKALILRNSHIGGHKFAGNVIIYTPRGASVWYGRVTPHDVESIVKNTIIGGQVLPPILRGGLNLARSGCKTLYDW
ncbi:Sucrase/ferredoxin-like-domain-containing protein [Phlebopus sp. FC_14]|nr:Sucrase/ferredoxin-like-domain-containing protein [Phlebopus sp. FC_14]